MAHKALEVELRDARANPSFRDEARNLHPLRTIPVLVEEDGSAIGDSGAITRYLDATYAGPRIWPESATDARDIFHVASLVDGALDNLINAGTRFFPLRNDPAWAGVKAEIVGRGQDALDALGRHVASLGRSTIGQIGWSGADMWLVTMVLWLEGLPARAPTYAPAAQIVDLGFSIPPALTAWVDRHRQRADVRALG